ncbi:Alpha/Beta hydrolase protein [Trametes meyenii]|nr:Alpha/Beta hydrolase protein [Trametes meyenii]
MPGTPSAATGALRAFLDSGAPESSTDYTTVVILHGWGWHGANFKKLIPLAKHSNARVVLLNRRDYPSSDPYTPSDLASLAHLASAPRSEESDADAASFQAARAREVFDYLEDFVRRERIPRPQDGKGGIVLVGWSIGSTLITALLANVGRFPQSADMKLSEYVRRLVLYDASYICYGYTPPPGWWQPLLDSTIPPTERAARFSEWVTGYFAHGDVFTSGAPALEFRAPLADPAPLLTRLTADELAESTYEPPQAPTGSENLIAQACIGHGTWGKDKDGALYLRDAVKGADGWRGVEVRHVWCDRSIWEMPWGAKLLAEELEGARSAGRPVRDITFVRVKGANHFAHWDFPEKTLRAFLGDETEIE